MVAEALAAAAIARTAFPRGGGGSLEPNAAQVLLALALADGRSASELAAQLRLAQPTVSNALKCLHEDGLVKETVDASDRRRRLQDLTARGSRRAQSLAGEVETRRRALKEPKNPDLTLAVEQGPVLVIGRWLSADD